MIEVETVLREKALPVLGTNGYPLQSSAVYGPIHSRRFGASLGINPLPVTYKFCDFDCVYCQYGWTPGPGNKAKGTNEKLKSARELLAEIKRSFQKFAAEEVRIDVITIAGNGEPTLHPEFLNFTKGLLRLRDQHFPGRPIGILSDSSQCHRPEIKEALEALDERCMKLDAADEETIRLINKPRGGFELQKTISALRNLKGFVIQSLFVKGSVNNAKPEQIDCWIEAIRLIAPRSVQVYTIDRPPADSGVQPVSTERLREIAGLCEKRTGIRSEVFD